MRTTTSEPSPGLPRWEQTWDSVDRILFDWARHLPDVDMTPGAIVSRIERLRAHLQAGMAEVFTNHGLTPADFRVIVALRRAGSPYLLSQARLTSQLALTSGTVSIRVDRLVKRGVVAREPDPDDKRGVLVGLTEDGLALFNEIASPHLANQDRMLAALTADERTTLADLLRRLLASFESGTVDVGLPLGIQLEPARVARTRRVEVGLSDTSGLLISQIIPGTPAAEAGLMRGDLITAADGAETCAAAALVAAVHQAGPGNRLRLSILRGDESLHVTVTLPATQHSATA